MFFGLSGIVGFVIDSFVLYLLKDSLGLYVARLVSFMTAVFSTWLFNRTITFSEQDSGYSKAKEF
ncbi:GtrA family protein [Chlorobium sp.]|uniref:GtrA family protein n=1 Tax=Chlorobium sp. TaxID=1095 RepID=UPI003FA5DB65